MNENALCQRKPRLMELHRIFWQRAFPTRKHRRKPQRKVGGPYAAALDTVCRHPTSQRCRPFACRRCAIGWPGLVVAPPPGVRRSPLTARPSNRQGLGVFYATEMRVSDWEHGGWGLGEHKIQQRGHRWSRVPRVTRVRTAASPRYRGEARDRGLIFDLIRTRSSTFISDQCGDAGSPMRAGLGEHASRVLKIGRSVVPPRPSDHLALVVPSACSNEAWLPTRPRPRDRRSDG